MKYHLLKIITICAVYSGFVNSFAAKELVYDPIKGIIFVDRKDNDFRKSTLSDRSRKSTVEKESFKAATRSVGSEKSSGIHLGRKKDPPELYFKSGLEYFKNGDFINALKNFMFADSVDHRPEYSLWIGKTLRCLGRVDEMLKTMVAIVNKESDSDVADDALFELALHYKQIDDYEKSMQLFSQLIDQYPFGLAYSTAEELREIAREQRRLMRAEMINTLSILGYKGDDLPSLYRKFQTVNHLPITETGDQQTVKTIKEHHRRYLEQKEARAATKLRSDRYKVFLYAATAAGVLNIFFLLVLLSQIMVRKRHVDELHKIIAELDVGKL